MTIFTTKRLTLKRFLKILKWTGLTILFLIISLWIFIQTPFGQNWIAGIVTNKLSKNLHTKVSIKHVNFSLFNRMHLEGVMIEDQQSDTLLYAGEIRVNITDWFFFRKNAVLKNVAIDDAIIKFQRTDSVWSQQFLFDYFGSSGSNKKSGGGIQFSLKKLAMKNVTFRKTDKWVGKDMEIHVASLNLDADELKFNGPQYQIHNLLIDQPVVVLRNYTGRRPKDTSTSSIITDDGTVSHEVWNTGSMLLQVNNLKITNGTFINDKETQRDVLTYFDGQHILFTAVNVDMQNAKLGGDSVIAKINLSAKERSGIIVKHLISDVKMTPQGMFFSNLDLTTNNSHIGDYFSMTYNGMWDMSDFLHKVKIVGGMNGTSVNSDDIAYFAPALSTWKKTISLKGKLRGTVADWTGRDLDISAGNNTLLNGDVTMTGLPDIYQTFIDFKANNFSTSYDDAVTMIPAMRKVVQPDLRKIRYVNFKGSFTGFIRDFVTFGTINTNLGSITTDLNMKLPYKQDPVYSGNIATDNFQLGEFLDNSDLGAISMTGTVKGKGFTDKSVNTLLDGTIRFADYKKYRYNNITVKGKLEKKLFEGFTSVRDENLHLDLKGVIDFNGPAPRFDLLADVEHSDFNKLHLTEDTITFKGKLIFNFTSNNIDDFLGTARITDAELIRNGFRLPFDSLIVHSDLSPDGQRELSVHSNEIDAAVTGHFSLTEFPSAATYLLNRYYPAYVDAPKKLPGKQSFHFDVLTYNIDDYIRMIHPKLSGFNNSHIVGDLNLDENSLDLTAEIPQFRFRGYNFDSTTIHATGSDHDLVLNGSTFNIGINDSLRIPFAKFSVNARNDSSLISIFSGASQAVDTANLNALVMTYDDGVKIEFDPSTFTINGKLWSIDESGELSFRSNTPVEGKLLLREGDQQIILRTQRSTKGDWNDFHVDLSKINLGDISPLFMPHNRMEGLVSGNILVENPASRDNMKISSDNIHTQYFRLDNDSLGEVNVTAAYRNDTKELKLKGETVNQEEFLGFDGSVFIGDPEKTANNLIALKAKNYPLKVLERFLGNLFSDIRGSITGDINLSGDFKHITVYGKGSLKKAGLKVNFTQCFYWINDTEINMKPTEIDLNGIVLTDSVTKNPIYLTGGIQHEAFRNMFYDLYISTRKPNTLVSFDKNGIDPNNKSVLLLNTTLKDNSQFFGRAKGTGSLSLTGPQSDMFMKIDAIASNTDSSNITIPSSRSRESGLADFLVERKYGREMTEKDFSNNNTRITYDVDITANPRVNVKVVMDDLTGDEINGRGSGTLNIRSGTTDPLYLNGRFDILEGSYLFTFQSFFKKPFEIRKNAENYIEWNGDPYNANIKFEASYRAERVSFDQLATLKKVSSGASNARGDVFVIASLTNKLFSPDIKFSLDFPSTSVAVTDPELALIIKQIQNNPNEINRQATYLIVFNSFAPSELGGDLNGKSGININTISGIILNVLNDQLNKILGNLFKNEKYNISLNTSLYTRSLVDQNSNTALNLGSNVNLSVGRSFFDNRFIISASGGFDAPLQQQTTQQGIQFLKDVTLEWLINPSGSIRVSFFYKENADYLTNIASTGPGKAKRIGGNLSYRKDFDRLGDIFRKKPKLPPPVKSETPANVPPITPTDPKKN